MTSTTASRGHPVLLLLCGLAIAHATLASTATLAPELRQQASLGLLPGEILSYLLTEVSLLTLSAGVLGTVLAGLTTGVSSDLVPEAPTALAVGLAAALVPAWRASARAHSDRSPRGSTMSFPHARGRLRAAIVQLSGIPGRTLLCLAAVAIGGWELVLLLGTHQSPGDTAATGLAVLLAAFVVADAGWSSVRDRGPELADLRIQGLLGIQVAGLVMRELAVVVCLGTALGGTAGLTVVAFAS
ncbi:hypothetical protein HH310_08320 [Actinoplanes sp. TBRC 11911]|uniref:hypothetical protein n=1 Tax=Actinoplanes sp. TBRC 11911 TaxID=2729386 RepID=UPI00145E3F60|nr:hypothetical protein [Actinoplanes sp. TBRC 11911]NMO51191.1 hypothetical protein [Actinoplanes sp. TBRC 11911]